MLASNGLRHEFEHVPGQKIFHTREDLANGLGDSMISVCFPASVTHPEVSKGLETATHRYFESIASKCVLLGHAPQELVDLFGFNPVVPVEPAIPDQLENLLSNISQYQESVERNYERLLEVGTWDVRAKSIISEYELVFG
jgi:hypothetical protein